MALRTRVDPDEVKQILADEVERALEPVARPLVIDPTKRPFVILVIGVNGSGKTTTIGKLAAKFRAEGKAVLLAAGDTFRAAAIEQLRIWARRTLSALVERDQGADAAGLAFDALTKRPRTQHRRRAHGHRRALAEPRRTHERTREDHPGDAEGRRRRAPRACCSCSTPPSGRTR